MTVQISHQEIEQELGRKLAKEERQAIEYAKKCTSRDICGHILVPIDGGTRCVRVMAGDIVTTDGRCTMFRCTQWNWSSS